MGWCYAFHDCPECGKKGAYIVRDGRYASVRCRYCGLWAELEGAEARTDGLALANGRRRWAKVEGR